VAYFFSFLFLFFFVFFFLFLTCFSFFAFVKERFHALGPIYYRDADGALLVYDITDHQSFERVQNWVKELRKMLGKDIVLCIAGNKIDLERDRNVTREEAEAYARTVGAAHFETSAKKYINVDEVFLRLTNDMLAQSSATLGKSGSTSLRGRGGRRGAGPIIADVDDVWDDGDDSSSSGGASSSSSSGDTGCCGN
jgi:Ras-related protein Rab-21